MSHSRLFHTVVVVGATLALGTTIACSGDDGTPSTDSQSTQPISEADAGPEAGEPTYPGWAPTK